MAITTVELEVLRMMTPARKLAVLHALIRQAWTLKAATLRETHPDLEPADLEALARSAVSGERT